MSRAAIGFFLALALGLGAVLWIVNQKQTSTGVPDPTAGKQSAASDSALDPNLVQAMRILDPRATPAREDELRRTPLGGWVLRTGPLDWPVDPQKPRDLLRALSELQPLEASSADGGKILQSTIPEDSPRVIVELEGGGARTFRISSSVAGGRTLILIDDGPTAQAEASLLNLVREPGPRGWRIPAAIPGASPETARVTLSAGDRTISLARLEGRWTMRTPVAARANPQAVSSLLNVLMSMPVERFIDEPAAPGISGLDRPRLVISVERDVRQAAPTTSASGEGDASRASMQTLRNDLVVGGPVDAAGNSLFASPLPPGSVAPVLLSIPASSVSSIATDPRLYLALTATGVAEADVFGVTVRAGTEKTYRREAGTWTKAESGGGKTPVEAGSISDLLELLTATNGEPSLAAGEDDLRVLTRIELLNIDGQTMDALAAGYTADGVFGVRSATVVWLYPGREPPAVLEMPAPDNLPPATVPTSARPEENK